MAADRSRHDPPCWMWSSSERCYIWWDGGEFTNSRCHWSGTTWVPTDDLHDPPLAGPPPADPGWYPVPGDPGADRWWDGTGWTGAIRRPVPAKGRWIMLALVACGAGLVLAGGVIATGSSLWLGTFDCAAQSPPAPPPMLWLVWGALVTVAAFTSTAHTRCGPHHRSLNWLVRIGTFLTVLSFPGWLWLGAGMGCGIDTLRRSQVSVGLARRPPDEFFPAAIHGKQGRHRPPSSPEFAERVLCDALGLTVSSDSTRPAGSPKPHRFQALLQGGQDPQAAYPTQPEAKFT